MQQILITLTAILALSACSSTPPPPPEPKGKIQAVNPSKINLADLYTQGRNS
ncbi:hypothetical protein [Vibrio sp. K4]|uniref:hypothetical protein n=1 Tax=Vibrio sp. K4 TaxID=3391579 RepID=UPI003DA76988